MNRDNHFLFVLIIILLSGCLHYKVNKYDNKRLWLSMNMDYELLNKYKKFRIYASKYPENYSTHYRYTSDLFIVKRNSVEMYFVSPSIRDTAILDSVSRFIHNIEMSPKDSNQLMSDLKVFMGLNGILEF